MASTERRHRKHSKHKRRHKHSHHHRHSKHKKRGRDKEKERLKSKEETPEITVDEGELQAALEQLERTMIAVRARYSFFCDACTVLHSYSQLHFLVSYSLPISNVYDRTATLHPLVPPPPNSTHKNQTYKNIHHLILKTLNQNV